MKSEKEHNSEMCWCRECVERLLTANAEYFKVWLARDRVRRATGQTK